MDKSKIILPVAIILGCVILGSFYYLSQTSQPEPTETYNENDYFQKKIECEKYKDKITSEINQYNNSQKPEIRDSSVPTNPKNPLNHLYIENKLLKEIFYSPKVNSCVYLESRRTLIKSDPNANPNIGDWGISSETYYLIDALTKEEIDFNKGLPSLQIIHRGEVFNNEKEADEIIKNYK